MAMAEENVVMDRETDETSSGFWERIRNLFSTGSEYIDADAEDLEYERRLWDHRIEGFLDSSLPEYLRDFGVLDEIALNVRDERVVDLSGRTHALLTYVQTLDTEVSEQEQRLAAIEKAAKKKAV